MYTISGGCMRDFTDACKKPDFEQRIGNIVNKLNKFRLYNGENIFFSQTKQRL